MGTEENGDGDVHIRREEKVGSGQSIGSKRSAEANNNGPVLRPLWPWL